MAQHAEQLAGYRHKCAVIPYGIDASPLAAPRTCGRARAIRRELGTPLLLFVGRLVPYKGVDVLMRAIATLDLRLAVVGDGPTPSRRRAPPRGRSRHVCRIGSDSSSRRVPRLRPVRPAISDESRGIRDGTIEAMACGKPVVSTAVASGVPWVNQHEVTGLVEMPAG